MTGCHNIYCNCHNMHNDRSEKEVEWKNSDDEFELNPDISVDLVKRDEIKTNAGRTLRWKNNRGTYYHLDRDEYNEARLEKIYAIKFFNDTDRGIPITEFDHYFDMEGLNLNKHNNWKKIEEFNEMSGTTVKKYKDHDHRLVDSKTTFLLPVIGYKMSIESVDKEMEAYLKNLYALPVDPLSGYQSVDKKSFRLNGKTYSRDKIYSVCSYSGQYVIKEIAETQIKAPTFTNEEIKLIPLNQKNVNVRYLHYSANSSLILLDTDRANLNYFNYYVKPSDTYVRGTSISEIIIDMKQHNIVTHIQKMGEIPIAELFPARNYDDSIKKRAKPESQISIINNSSSIPWVNAIQVEYQNEKKKWVFFGTYSTSQDVFNPSLIALKDGGIYTRYLRITPLKHHLRPSFRIALYGIPGDIHDIKSGEKEIAETVDYIVKTAMTGSKKQYYVNDGIAFGYGHDDYYHNRPTKSEKRVISRKMIYDGIMSHYDDISDDSDDS
jgi:hypothetical protein